MRAATPLTPEAVRSQVEQINQLRREGRWEIARANEQTLYRRVLEQIARANADDPAECAHAALRADGS